MKQLAVSKPKVHCLAVVEEVKRNGNSVAEIVPAQPQPKESQLSSMRDEREMVGDIADPLGAFDE